MSLMAKAQRVAVGALVVSAVMLSDLVKHEGGFVERAYLDSVGVPTVCAGHTATVRWNYVYSREECEELLRTDVNSAQYAVRRAIKVPLYQSEFDALVSFCYNVGNHACTTSTMFRLINKGQYALAAKQFDRWVYAKKLDCRVRKNNCYGVYLRRMDEKARFTMDH